MIKQIKQSLGTLYKKIPAAFLDKSPPPTFLSASGTF